MMKTLMMDLKERINSSINKINKEIKTRSRNNYTRVYNLLLYIHIITFFIDSIYVINQVLFCIFTTNT